MLGSRSGQIVVDIRNFTPALRRGFVFGLVDRLVQMGASDELVLICDHEPAGLGYQIDLRRETRGRFSFAYDQRSDGAWVAIITPNGSGSDESRQ